MQHTTRLLHRTALVTGGGRGVGRGIATELARAGCRVAVTYIADSETAAHDTVAALREAGTDALAIRADVTRAADVTAMIDAVAAAWGHLDILVNNAGVQTWGALLDVTEAEWDFVVDTNMKGCFLTTQAAGRHMRDHGGGAIVNIGSGCNKEPFPRLAAYTASKGGIEMFTRVSAVELGPSGIRVNCVAPGTVEVERTREESPDYAERWSRLTPLRRIGTPADIGRAVAFLASDDASFITGQTLWVDGGLFTQPVWAYSIPARYFDGRHSQPHDVTLRVEGTRLIIAGDGVDREEPVDRLFITPAPGRNVDVIALGNGAACHVSTSQSAALPLRRLAPDAPRADRAGHAWWMLPLAAAVVCLALWWGYRLGLPMLSAWIAGRLPPAVSQTLGAQALASLDATELGPSTIDAARRADLERALRGLPVPNDLPIQLEFRAGRRLGANALALPSGTIVVTDELLALAAHDDEVLGVLAHEVGHVVERHGLRAIVQHSALAAAFAWIVGDAGLLAAAAPAALLAARYSQEFERRADRFAADMLRQSGRSAESLATMLERLEDAAARQPTGVLSSYLSTHPPTAERLEALRWTP